MIKFVSDISPKIQGEVIPHIPLRTTISRKKRNSFRQFETKSIESTKLVMIQEDF